MFQTVLHAVILGFGLILPVGVQNVFVFNQGASQRTYLGALPVILTASLCDTLLILAAVLGVSLIVLTFSWLQAALYGIGFLFLLYMGWALWKSKPSAVPSSQEQRQPKKQILFAASVSLLNPHAILDTVGVIGTNSLNYAGGEKWVFMLSIMCVSWLWFFGLAFAGRLVGKHDTSGKFIARLNKVSACLIWGVAAYMSLQFV
ncbi:LysE/ArgO family amino acid transporter [Paenibacillus aceris]|uniref:L-lysine exporter family protein LysE/ArgO n=1 Tax=Paenibacillus aceris TaxID=869555 RepID=A0ABS4HSE9_9BACL|nr:LysE/ArgO family amino acid transporter [Paenibacillus aceris]MBP1961552.1 L-lysine exporter family protein LysE/ArgO [Paenibacillus aceris]NHW37672.1 amino acid transporter [Paenibacillus aceris]